MTTGRVLTCLAFVCLVAGVALSADWPQWRGPNRDGIVPDCPPLADSWPATGPKKLWESEPIPCEGESGYGTVSVAAGRVFLFVSIPFDEAIPTRTLPRDGLNRLGWLQTKPPDALLKSIEEARVSAERESKKGQDINQWAGSWVDMNVVNPSRLTTEAMRSLGWSEQAPPEKLLKAVEDARVSPDLTKLKGKDAQDWIAKWIETNITDAKEKESFGGWAMARLKEGRNALPLDILDKVAAIRDKDFAKQSELDKWLSDNKIQDPARSRVWQLTHPDQKEKAQFKDWAFQRLREGKDAPSLDSLEKLLTIRDKQFATQADLDKWLADNAIDGVVKKRVLAQIATTVHKGNDRIYCLDAANGKTVWKVEFPGAPNGYGSSSTPCIDGGRCYVAGSDGGVYCLDVADGKDVWKDRVGRGPKNCSFVVFDGLAIIAAGPLTAFDAKTGAVAWKQPKVGDTYCSPSYWKKDDKTYFVLNSDRGVNCFDPKTGNVLWTVPGGGWSSTVIDGDRMVVFANHAGVGVTAYKMSLEKAEKMWTVNTFVDRGASPLIRDGHVYVTCGGGAMCIKLDDGKVAWQKKIGTPEIASLVLADGKMFIEGGGNSMMMLDATPQDCKVLATAKVGLTACTSPAIVDGKMYLRSKKCVACYELPPRPAVPPVPPAPAPAVPAPPAPVPPKAPGP